MERADYDSIDSREGGTDTFATDEEGSPPTTIHTLRRDNGVDNEMFTLASQATIETVSTFAYLIEQPPLAPQVSGRVLSLGSNMILKPSVEPKWDKLSKKGTKDKYAAEKKRANCAVEEAQWPNKELNELRVESLEYVYQIAPDIHEEAAEEIGGCV